MACFYPSCSRGIECAVSGQSVVVNNKPQTWPLIPLTRRVPRGACNAGSQEVAYGGALVCDKDSEQRGCDCKKTHRVCTEGIHGVTALGTVWGVDCSPSVGALQHYILGGCVY
jgi:hypothetical protein